MTGSSASLKMGPREAEKGGTLKARPMEEGDRGEAARPREEMNATTLLVDLRASAREGAKNLAEGSVEEDWQGMVVPDAALYLKEGGDESR